MICAWKRDPWVTALGGILACSTADTEADGDVDGVSTAAAAADDDDDDDDDDDTGPGDDDDDTGPGDDDDDDDTGPGDDDDTGVPDPIPDECITEVTPGHHVFSCGGLSFDLELPPQCLESPCGLVVDVHGYTMSADMEDKNTGMRALGIEHGYVVVQPNANPEPPNSSWSEANDQAVFDFAMRTANAFHLDDNRLHFTGFSQGGFMSWRFLCKYADTFASIAPAAACGMAIQPGCDPASANLSGTPHILYLHGTTDAAIDYGCAEPQRDSVLAAYGISGDPEVVETTGMHRWNRWTSDAGVDVEMIDHDYTAESMILAGHCFPGSPDLTADLEGQLLPYGCDPISPLVWGAVAMQFFIDHPKP